MCLFSDAILQRCVALLKPPHTHQITPGFCFARQGTPNMPAIGKYLTSRHSSLVEVCENQTVTALSRTDSGAWRIEIKVRDGMSLPTSSLPSLLLWWEGWQPVRGREPYHHRPLCTGATSALRPSGDGARWEWRR